MLRDNYKIDRCDADRLDDPNRCQDVRGKGQCLNKAVPGGSFCLVHGGNKVLKAQEAAGLRNYRLTKYHIRVAEKANGSAIKDLRDEVGILRMLLEERFNVCENTAELLLQSSSISDLVMKINVLVTSCHKLETMLGGVLDKAVIITIAEQIITIISAHITDSEILDKIAAEVLDIVDKAENNGT